MFGRIGQRAGDFALDWAAPILLGLTTAAVVWTIWYLTKAPCTAVAAGNGLCNPYIIARYITVEILLQSGGAALAVGALKGGYDRLMLRDMLNRERAALSQEREARQAAEQHLAEERKRADESHALLTEMLNSFREERRREAEQRQREEEERREEHRVFIATQQALLDAVSRLTQQSNGYPENG